MAINKKLIHFKNKENFDTEVANGNILDNSIVFIQDSKEISTHGTVYKTVNWSILKKINKGILYENQWVGVVVDFKYPVHSDITVRNNTNDITILCDAGTASSDTRGLSNFDINTAYADPKEDDMYVYQLVKLFTFNIENVEYQAVEGMTWSEWIDSDYNTDNLYIESNKIKNNKDSYNLVNGVFHDELPNYKIINTTYLWD